MNFPPFASRVAMLIPFLLLLCCAAGSAAVVERWSTDLEVEPEPQGYPAGTFYNRAEQVVADGSGGVAVRHASNLSETYGGDLATTTVTWVNSRGKVIYTKKVAGVDVTIISANSKSLLISVRDAKTAAQSVFVVNREGDEEEISGVDVVNGLEGTLDNSFQPRDVFSDASNIYLFRFSADRKQIAVVKISVNLLPSPGAALPKKASR